MAKHMLISLAVFTLLSVNALVGILIFKELNPSQEAVSEATSEDTSVATVDGEPMDDIPDEPDIVDDGLDGVWDTESTFNDNQGQGGVEGTITWQYNDFVGTKGDVNAKVYLIPQTVDFNKVSLEELKDYFINGFLPSNARVYFTKADGYGNYKIHYVPRGSYILMFISSNTFNLDDIVTSEAQTHFPPLFQQHWNWLFGYLQSRKHHVEPVYINEDQILTISKDFGYKM